MAQKVNIVLVDDLDQSEADETVKFGLDGTDYEMDLTTEHAEELREKLAPYVAHARKAEGGRRRSARSSSTAASSGPSAKEIREWARENGWEVPERGRVAADVREAYDAAH
ncbi:Lsr2 family protein [Nocardioidaceae bacterium]|nr:Lsr2 family protein [Nocardioidaceae bacterium]